MDNQTPLPQPPQQPMSMPPTPPVGPTPMPPVPGSPLSNAPLPSPALSSTPPSNSALPPSSMPETPVTVGDPRQQVIEHIKESNTVLVTVSNSPSVDQLASCIAITILLNKLGKHATAVFSGEVPSTIEFLQPEKTLEKNTDSLRDFIIALDKAKADRLRYKVEDKFVKIFITPYKTSISEDDLEFTQGDLNCDLIVALGVHQQQDLDQAIIAHGRILHDATTIAINNSPENNNIGNINWIDTSASSISELITNIAPDIGSKNLIDPQIATALLTGIVSSTERFSNDKTSPKTMNASAILMAAGANQQLVATKLEPPPPPPPAPEPPQDSPPDPPSDSPAADSGEPAVEEPKTDEPPAMTVSKSLPKAEKKEENGEGVINVQQTDENGNMMDLNQLAEEAPEEDPVEQIQIDNQGQLHRLEGMPVEESAPPPSSPPDDSHHLLQGSEPSTLGSANTPYEALDSEPNEATTTLPPVVSGTTSEPAAAGSQKIAEQVSHENETLSQIEKEVGAHESAQTVPNLAADSARSDALVAAESTEKPASMGAQPLGPDLHDNEPTMNMPLPPNVVAPTDDQNGNGTATAEGSTKPPPLPPPIINRIQSS